MSAEPAKPVRCSRCRNVHDKSERVWKPVPLNDDMRQSTCPQCGSLAYRRMPGKGGKDGA